MSSAAAPEPPGSHSASLRTAARVAEIFERHGRMTYGICRAMLRDVHEAEDAAQQAFLSAHRALLGGASVRDEGAWIATIARNECRARISAAMRAPLPAAREEVDDLPHVVDDAERRLQAGELRDALAELPERQREAVVLRYVYGLRYGEVAKALGLSRPATEALLFRARRTMRVRLRHAAAAVLIVPLSVREELALALPGFEREAGTGAATAGVVGGVLAKLASAPAAAKVATATVAVSAVGAVGTVESDRPVRDVRTELQLVSPVLVDRESELQVHATSDRHGGRSEEADSDRSGRGRGGDDSADDRSDDRGPGSDDAGEREMSGRGEAGSGGGDDSDGTADEAESRQQQSSSSGLPDRSDGGQESISDDARERSGSSGSGSGEVDEPDSGSGSSGSGSGSSSSSDGGSSSGSGSDDEPDDHSEDDHP